MTIEDGRLRLAEIVHDFAFADDAFDALPAPSASRSTPESTYSSDQEHAMLLAMAREIEAHLQCEASVNRAHSSLGPFGRMDGVAASAVASEIAIGHLYQILAVHGNNAMSADVDCANLVRRGVSRDMITIIKREVAFHGRRELGTSWTFGPDRTYFERFLSDTGADLGDANIMRLRRSYLQLYAEFLFDAESRYAGGTTRARQILDTLKNEKLATGYADTIVASNMMTKATEPLVQSGARPGATMPPPSTDVTVVAEIMIPQVIAVPMAPSRAPISFIEKVDRVAIRKSKAKSNGAKDGWTAKTAAQHRSIAKLFTKFAGTDNACLLSQEHIGGYRDLLDLLPKNYGKSSSDFDRSIDEILVRCEDLDEDEVGLAGGTINRHLTQLGNCLAELKGHGADIGVIGANMRADDTPVERACFTTADLETLFASHVWTGKDVIHGSAYFVPLLGYEDCARLSEITGLLCEDINLEEKFFHIRPNENRGVKNKSSVRRLPIMPEAERLGFCDYIAAIKSLGYKLAFPDLRRRGSVTALSNLYYKDWVTILTAALPNSRSERKSYHSFRKGGNTQMGGDNVNDPLRCQIMGHAYRDVNGRNYTDEIPIDKKRIALAHIPIMTSSIRAAPIRLHPGLAQK